MCSGWMELRGFGELFGEDERGKRAVFFKETEGVEKLQEVGDETLAGAVGVLAEEKTRTEDEACPKAQRGDGIIECAFKFSSRILCSLRMLRRRRR